MWSSREEGNLIMTQRVSKKKQKTKADQEEEIRGKRRLDIQFG